MNLTWRIIRPDSLFPLLSVLTVLAAGLTSCMPKEPKPREDVVLQVNVTNTGGLSWVYLRELDVSSLKTVDSFNVKKTGRHSFRIPVEQEGFYLLQTRPNTFITLLLAPGEQVELFVDARKMTRSYSVRGSPGSALLREFHVTTGKNLDRLDSLKTIFSRIRYQDDFAIRRQELDAAYRQIFLDQRDYVTSFIRSHCGSLAPVFVINQRFGSAYPVNIGEDTKLFEQLDSCLMLLAPGNRHVLDHHERVTEKRRRDAEHRLTEERLAPGNPAHEVMLPDIGGNKRSLSSLKGKVVLLYFWTALTGKARQDHALMKPFYQQTREQGLEIVSVSLDMRETVWKAAMKVDQLPWLCLNDHAGAKGPLARLHAVRDKLPLYYVIDPEGNYAGSAFSFTEIRPLLETTLRRRPG